MCSSPRRRLAALAVALVVTLRTIGAAAQPAPSPEPDALATPLHVRSTFTLRTDGGSELRVVPAYIVSETSWDALDVEVRRLQEVETRITAENASLRKSAAGPGRRPMIYAIATALAVGIAAGYYIEHARE